MLRTPYTQYCYWDCKIATTSLSKVHCSYFATIEAATSQTATAEYVNAHVHVQISFLGVSQRYLQAFFGPAVVQENTVASIEK